MCHWVRCPVCKKARISGCGDEEHEAALLARVPKEQVCMCKEEQMREMRARELAARATP